MWRRGAHGEADRRRPVALRPCVGRELCETDTEFDVDVGGGVVEVQSAAQWVLLGVGDEGVEAAAPCRVTRPVRR